MNGINCPIVRAVKTVTMIVSWVMMSKGSYSKLDKGRGSFAAAPFCLGETELNRGDNSARLGIGLSFVSIQWPTCRLGCCTPDICTSIDPGD